MECFRRGCEVEIRKYIPNKIILVKLKRIRDTFVKVKINNKISSVVCLGKEEMYMGMLPVNRKHAVVGTAIHWKLTKKKKQTKQNGLSRTNMKIAIRFQ